MDNQMTVIETELETVRPSALEALQNSEIMSQISTAHRFPRTLSKVKADMMSFATLDQETAESCFYSVPRGGKNIQGPSVRLAEIAVSCYGNLRAGSRIIDTVTTGDNPHVTVQAVAHDLEKNVAVTVEKRRRIVGKKKNMGKIDEDDINLAANAGAAIAFRDAIYKVIPLALIKPVYEAAKAVAIGDAKTLSERRDRAMASLGKMGIDEKRVLGALGKAKADDIDLTDLETLFGLHTAIKDGQTTIDEAFPKIIAEAKVGAPKEPAKTVSELAAAERKSAEKPAETPAPENKPAGPDKKKLIADIMKLAREENMGRSGLEAKLAQFQYIDEGKTLDDLDASILADIFASWKEFITKAEGGAK